MEETTRDGATKYQDASGKEITEKEYLKIMKTGADAPQKEAKDAVNREENTARS